MGNSGSQKKTRPEIDEIEWLHSFPRTHHLHRKFNFEHKVLPTRDANLKLKSTYNGEYLQSLGTIRGGRDKLLEIGEQPNMDCTKSFEDCSSSDAKDFSTEKEKSRKILLHGLKYKLYNDISSQEIKPYVSEPDLRYASRHIGYEFREKKSKKKYKAPSPPQKYVLGNENQVLPKEENILNPRLPIRKARLFKTRAETKKQSSHLQEDSEDYLNSVNSNNNNNNKLNEKEKRLSLPSKLIDSNDFYKELKDATERLRYVEIDNSSTNSKLNTLDPNISSNRDLKERLMGKIENQSQSKNSIIHCSRGEASGKESTTSDVSPLPTSRNLITKDPRQKQLFYFGMDENATTQAQLNKGVFKNFTTHTENSTASDISTDIESDENEITRSGIDIQLRPILPKKQLEIPRFSPSAAWRLLSIDTSDNTTGTMISDDVPVLMEDHIETYSRPHPPIVNAGQRSSNDKSGDSGISGDDVDAVIPIACCDDDVTSGSDNNAALNQNKIPIIKPERVSWTPQQDLGDDSSIEEDLDNQKSLQQKSRPHLGPHTFSLSLPRDNRLAAYMIEKYHMPQSSGLQKFKKSLSGVLGNLSNKKDLFESSVFDEKSANWSFSKSAPNSLTHTFHSLERHKIQEIEDQPYTSNVSTASRLIYLPEIDNYAHTYKRNMISYKTAPHSKSCEDIGLEMENTAPQPLQDPISADVPSWKSRTKEKKYTFQSTIRQIERKRLSDKLSKEAEKREKKRIREFEAMQKVEEEFQKKREREKENIRQQLRLFSVDDGSGWHSLPLNFELEQKEHRSEPDGAFSSVSSSLRSSSSKNFDAEHRDFKYPKIPSFEKPTSAYTKELSEYRQTQRNYKDYSSNVKYSSDKPYSNKQTTVHPQVSCNMPKIKGFKLKKDHNYRKDFAAGVRNSFTANSTEDSQNQSTKSQHGNRLMGPGYNSSNHLLPN